LRANSAWRDAADHSFPTLDEDLAAVVGELIAAGHREILRAELSCEPFDVAVVKVFVPGLRHNKQLF
jgi:ribosomal protein S12 methylthiotransferase accessory factor YcaO